MPGLHCGYVRLQRFDPGECLPVPLPFLAVAMGNGTVFGVVDQH